MNGEDETRLLRIWFELLPQVNNVRIDCARVRIILVTPHGIKQTIARECFRRMRAEVSEQRKFLGRKIDRLAGAQHFVAADVYLDVTEFDTPRVSAPVARRAGAPPFTRAINSRIEKGLVT